MQDLLRNKARLEHDIKIKSNSLFIDRFHQIPQTYCWQIWSSYLSEILSILSRPTTHREKCLSMRKSFPVVSLATKLWGEICKIAFESLGNVFSVSWKCLFCVSWNGVSGLRFSWCPLRMFVKTKLFHKKFWNDFSWEISGELVAWRKIYW